MASYKMTDRNMIAYNQNKINSDLLTDYLFNEQFEIF